MQLENTHSELLKLEKEREELRQEHIESIVKRDRLIDELAEELEKVRN